MDKKIRYFFFEISEKKTTLECEFWVDLYGLTVSYNNSYNFVEDIKAKFEALWELHAWE